ncbi:MAG: hypothetical protein DWI58_06910 [Chloroflexi bacterium]|nr:MAG: hypothetical protein DWI58_06910 [Chloroflexota bacterium]
MKVQFTPEEVHTMLEAVVEEVLGVKLDQKDRASVRRWLVDEMTPGSTGVKVLADKLNEQLQQSQDNAAVSSIKKPDWI